MRTTLHTGSIVRHLTTAGAALAAVVATAAVLASPAAAQGGWGRGGYGYGGNGNDGDGRRGDGARPLFVWNGRVDREAYIVMQNGDVRTRIDGYANGAGGRVRVASALPPADGFVDVRVQEGRGRVDVVEQPSGRNGYRTVVRVRDDDAGAGDYRLVATWRPAGGYGNGGYNGGYDGRDRDRDRDRDDGRYGDGRYGNGGYNGGGNGAGTYAGSGVVHWRGRVDDVEEIRIQGTRVDTRTVSGGGASNVRAQLQGGALPAGAVNVRVDDRSGRGRVTVVQQPRAWNGYTAVVRVEDRDPGAGSYDFDVSW